MNMQQMQDILAVRTANMGLLPEGLQCTKNILVWEVTVLTHREKHPTKTPQEIVMSRSYSQMKSAKSFNSSGEALILM